MKLWETSNKLYLEHIGTPELQNIQLEHPYKLFVPIQVMLVLPNFQIYKLRNIYKTERFTKLEKIRNGKKNCMKKYNPKNHQTNLANEKTAKKDYK